MWSSGRTTVPPRAGGLRRQPRGSEARRPNCRASTFKSPLQGASMKITNCRIIVCCPGRNFVTLKIETDQGLHGIGDATLNGRELAVAAYLTEHIVPTLIGRDPARIEDIWQYLYRGAYWRRGPVTMSAIAAVDTALWDLKAKAGAMPLYHLRGGARRSDGGAAAAARCGYTATPTVRRWRRPLPRRSAMWVWATRPSACSQACPVSPRPTACRATRCSTSRPTAPCRSRIAGRRASIWPRHRSCSRRLARRSVGTSDC